MIDVAHSYSYRTYRILLQIFVIVFLSACSGTENGVATEAQNPIPLPNPLAIPLRTSIPTSIGTISSSETQEIVAPTLKPTGNNNFVDSIMGLQSGKINIHFSQSVGDSKYLQSVNDITIQPDGKMLTVGMRVETIPQESGGTQQAVSFLITRFNQDGSLDTTFGDRGLVISRFSSYGEIGEAIALQEGGKIVVAGISLNSDNYWPNTDTIEGDLALARYNFDGSPDLTFGEGGGVITKLNDPSWGRVSLSRVNDLEILHNGKIVLSVKETETISRFVIFRFNLDGTLDNSFNGDGIVLTDILSGNNDECFAILEQSDGKIVAFGDSGNFQTGVYDVAITRYNPDGQLDTDFGDNGIVTTATNVWRAVTSGEYIQPDGKIIVSLRRPFGWKSESALTLLRYNPDGSVDNSFGNGGIVSTMFDYKGGIHDVTLQLNGKIIITGQYETPDDKTLGCFVMRYNTDGTLDYSFGKEGITYTNFPGELPNCRVVYTPADNIIIFGDSRDPYPKIPQDKLLSVFYLK